MRLGRNLGTAESPGAAAVAETRRGEREEIAGWEIFSSGGGKAGGYQNIGKAVGRKSEALSLKSQAPLLGSDRGFGRRQIVFRGLVSSSRCWKGQAINLRYCCSVEGKKK